MSSTNWADDRLSQELPMLRAQGEGQELEFKEDFPEQGHELAKTIAAFATSGGGRILLGVADDGSLVGLTALDTAARDKIALRAQNLIKTVQPPVNAEVLFATEAGKTVLCIRIPKQTEPVYYYDHRPLLRDSRLCRPASPDEVKLRIWSHPSSEFKRREEELRLRQIERANDLCAAAAKDLVTKGPYAS